MRIPYVRPFCILVALAVVSILCACAGATFAQLSQESIRRPHIERLVAVALSWRVGATATAPAGLALLRDGAPFMHRNLAVARSIERSNPRLSPFEALYLADVAVAAAERASLDVEFFCATILQESAFDPNALSSAGAVGIAQFTVPTADAYNVDPFNPESAIEGAASLLSGYVIRYEGVYADPYAGALAAYNAGPASVAAYRGVPPYAETRTYIADVYDRWARLLRDESPLMQKRV